MMELEPLNRMDPDSRPDIVRTLAIVARVIGLVVAAILCLAGLYLLLDVYFTVAKFVESPKSLEPALAAWDTALRGAPAAVPPDAGSGNPSFLRFISELVAQLSNGNLARPLGGFIVFLFMTILLRIAVAVLGAGTKLLLALAAADAAKTDGEQPG